MKEIRAYHPKELARVLGVSIKTLDKLRRTGDGIPWVRLGRRVIYPVDEVERFLSTKTYRSTSEYMQITRKKEDGS